MLISMSRAALGVGWRRCAAGVGRGLFFRLRRGLRGQLWIFCSSFLFFSFCPLSSVVTIYLKDSEGFGLQLGGGMSCDVGVITGLGNSDTV
ncbi:hypothetical protein BJX76DRAFT_182730 [Aspergillus varians]